MVGLSLVLPLLRTTANEFSDCLGFFNPPATPENYLATNGIPVWEKIGATWILVLGRNIGFLGIASDLCDSHISACCNHHDWTSVSCAVFTNTGCRESHASIRRASDLDKCGRGYDLRALALFRWQHPVGRNRPMELLIG